MDTQRKITFSVLMSLMVILLASGAAIAGDYPSLEGVKTIKAVIDFRDGDPTSAQDHLALVGMTMKDKAITSITEKPHFVVIFMGSSVKLLSNQRDGFTAEESKKLDAIAELVPKLTEAGVRLEVCDIALEYFQVDPQSLPKDLKHVPNGWISSIGYQSQGYVLVPSY